MNYLTSDKTKPLFEVVKTTMGVTSIKNNEVNEIMHNPVGPWDEANGLYIDQSGFRDSILLGEDPSEIVVFDVGLGAGTNALVAIDALMELKESKPCRPLKIVSFEIDLRLLEFTIENAEHFDFVLKYKKALEDLLKNHFWEDPENQITWKLYEGNFLTTLPDCRDIPDLIFYDAYSPKMNPEMWSYACFKLLRDHCHKSLNRGTSLFTYSRSTPIRSAFLLAGFYVGAGLATGLKDETTQASTRLEDLESPLGEAWLGRWSRSDRPNPIDFSDSNESWLKDGIKNHLQFKTSIES